VYFFPIGREQTGSPFNVSISGLVDGLSTVAPEYFVFETNEMFPPTLKYNHEFID
jgi:hypothetical protein